MSHLSRTSAVFSCCSARQSHAILLFKRRIFLVCHSVGYLFQLAGIRLALHPLPPGAEGCLHHNPRLQYWKVVSDTIQHCVKVVKVMLFFLLYFYICLLLSLLHQMPIYILTYLLFHCLIFLFCSLSSLLLFIYILQTKAQNTHPCECASVCLLMSTLISTCACCRLLRRSGSENKQSSSYLA